MSYTKATLADLDHAGATAVGTGRAAADTGDRAAVLVQQLEAGLDEVTSVLVDHVRRLALALRDELARTAASLGVADWEGRAREAADAAELAVRQRVDAVLVGAEAGAESLRHALTGQAAALVAEILQRFGQAMDGVDLAYRGLADAEAAFAANLVAADAAFTAEP